MLEVGVPKISAPERSRLGSRCDGRTEFAHLYASRFHQSGFARDYARVAPGTAR